MPDTPENARLRPATPEEIADSLSHALRYRDPIGASANGTREGCKRVHHADEMMARITAERLVRHLERCGYVLMRRPEAQAPTASHHDKP